MGLLNSALQIGRTAILGYQGALQVVGNNISSVGNPDYTRLSPQLESMTGSPINGDLQPGAGVAMTAIQRNIDEALEGRVRLAIGSETSAATQVVTMAQIEAFFDDLSGTGVGARLTQLFNTFDEVRNTPEDLAIRDLAINDGMRMAESIRELRAQLTRLGDDIDSQIASIVESADQIATEIARLNSEITAAEAGGSGQALALRDQRDAQLRDLSELFDVTVREQENGMINVYVGSEALVQGNTVRGLVAVQEFDGQSVRTSVRFADTNQQIDVRGGRLEGLIAGRDQHRQIAALDELAAALIDEVNRIHADGQGLAGFTSLTGSYDVLSAAEALDSSADDMTTQVDGVTVSVTADNRLELMADEGFSFTFGHDGQEARTDTSGVLAALGLNTFFTGTDAQSIAVNQVLVEQPRTFAAASVFLAGDGTNAGRLAELGTLASQRLGDISITEFYSGISNRVAVDSAAVRDELDAASTVYFSLQSQRESISGVNLDEEAIALVKYERAFQGAARFVSTVDQMISELLVLLR